MQFNASDTYTSYTQVLQTVTNYAHFGLVKVQKGYEAWLI